MTRPQPAADPCCPVVGCPWQSTEDTTTEHLYDAHSARQLAETITYWVKGFNVQATMASGLLNELVPPPAAPLDLAPIQARHETYAAIHSASGVYAHCAAQESAEDVPALLAEVTRLREINQRLDDSLKRALRAADEDPATCLSCGHLESAHDPDGERDCHASGAQFAACNCTCFIACYPAPASAAPTT